jgi:hypothetical protein
MRTAFHVCRAWLSAAVLIAGVAHNAHAANGSIGPCSVSNALQISSELQKPVDRMLRVSPTFLSQYCRIVRATGLLVGVRMDIELMERRLRARSVVRRYRSGLVVVAVAIAPGPRNEEWIAHEFEHILEQLDGLDLSKLARMRARQVWFSGPALIETHRAIEAGGSCSTKCENSRVHARLPSPAFPSTAERPIVQAETRSPEEPPSPGRTARKGW